MKGIRGFVTQVTRISHSLTKISFRLSQSLFYQPGQSIFIELVTSENKNKRKQVYTLCGAPEEAYRTNHYEILAESHPVTGMVEGLGKVRAGDLLKVEGPVGNFAMERVASHDQVVWLATLSGLGPFLSFVRSQQFKRLKANRIVLLVDVIHERDLIYREVFESKGITVIPCVAQPQDWVDGFWGKVNALLKSGRFRVNFGNATFFIAGEETLSSEWVKTLITEKSVAPNKIVREQLLVRLATQREEEGVWVPVELVKEDQKEKKEQYPSLLKAA